MLASKPKKHGNNSRHILIAVIFSAALFIAFWPRSGVKDTTQQEVLPIKTKKVQIDLYVMSMCPDARHCQSAFQRITANISSLVSMRTEYIARLSEDQQQVNCMHGPAECNGNKLQLCLQEHMPADHNLDYFYNTLLCDASGDVADSKHLTSCMTKSGVPAELQSEVLTCAGGPEGTALQVASAKKVTENDVKKSCTVFIDGKKRCIRDGGRWYDCDGGDSDAAFVKTICEAHKAALGSPAPECAAALQGGA